VKRLGVRDDTVEIEDDCLKRHVRCWGF